jgi:hypothetical protein
VAIPKNLNLPQKVDLIPTDQPLPDDFPFTVSTYTAGKRIVANKVPDTIADLLEDLRDAHDVDITTDNGTVVPAGTVKYKTVTTPTPEHADLLVKHVRSYSKNELAPTHSVRLSRLSPTTVRVGVGPVRVRNNPRTGTDNT